MTISLAHKGRVRGAIRRRFPAVRWRELAAVMIVLTTLPSLSIMILGASSLAMGLALACTMILALLVWHGRRVPICGKLLVNNLAFAFALWVAVLGHAFVASSITGFIDWQRALSSLLLVTLVVAASSALREIIERSRSSDVVRAMRLAFAVFVVEAVLALLGVPALGPTSHFMPIIFFMEPSQFSLGFMPFLMFAVISERGARRLVAIAAGLTVGLLIQSLTLLVGLGLIVALMVPPRRLVIAIALVAPIFLVIDTSYYVNRLTLGEDVENLSALAFLQGWERALLNIQDTHGMGVGFQQFGLVGDIGFFQERIVELFSTEDLNILDGGTNGSKLVGEFGIFGIVMLLLYLGAMLYAVAMCKLTSDREPMRAHKQFFAACIVAAFTEFFIRGGGYMSAGMMLLVTGLLWIVPVQVMPHLRRLGHRMQGLWS